jgi:pSer/pThr/pTyr-binding forkhead associated (FHA) protein
MDAYIDVKIDIFENIGQHARVRENITVATLIKEILKEFDDLSGQPDNFALFLVGSGQPLEASYTLKQLDIKPWETLLFDYKQRSGRRELLPAERFCVREEKSGNLFRIDWQPAIIGRPSKEPDHNMKLAVNLTGLPMGETVSRAHAKMTVRDSVVYIERTAENNSLSLNGVELALHQTRALHWGDRIEVGSSKITLIVEHTKNDGYPVSTIKVTTNPKEEAVERPPVLAKEAPIFPLQMVVDGTKPIAVVKLIKAEPDTLEGGGIGDLIQLTQFPFQLGRQTLKLNSDSGVSRMHVEFDYNEATGEFSIRDMDSKNGLKVNDQLIKPGYLGKIKHGDEIQLGKQVAINFLIVN